MEFLAELASPLVHSVLLGSFVALMAVGLTLTYAVTRVLNIAHAELVTLGAYATVVAINLWGWGLPAALAFAVAVSAPTALLMDELVYRRMIRARASMLYILVASIGIGIALRHLIYIFADWMGWLSVKARLMVSPLWHVGYATITDLFLWVVPAAALAALGLFLFLHRSRTGKAMRAVADNLDLASASGVPVVRVRRVAWLIAGGLAGLAGGLWAVYAPITPEMGWIVLLRVVAASILGGLVSIWGTIAGAYVVGLGENLGIFLARDWLGVPIEYRSLITFLIIIAVLLLRPSGFAGLRPPRLRAIRGGA